MHKKGFSLVELSITLVIISLLIAAIAGGIHLMQATRINKVISEMTGYGQAIDNFQLSYHNLPGDMPNATQFWSNVRNGDGNTKIEGNTTERLQAWTHLSKARMISSAFTGNTTDPGIFEAGVNVPGSAIKNAYYMVGYEVLYPATTGRAGHTIALVSTDTAHNPEGGALSPQDARIIDKKLDETANPADGNLFVLRAAIAKSTAGLCVTNSYTNASNADYDMSDHTDSCRLALWIN